MQKQVLNTSDEDKIVNNRASMYLVRAELVTEDEDKTHSLKFEKVMFVRELNQPKQTNTLYDPSLGIYVERTSPLSYLYEVETEDVSVFAKGKLSKAEDLIRRLHYRYDWIQIKVNSQGIIMAVENVPELKMRWGRLKNRVLEDYYGEVTENYLKEIDNEFVTETKLLKIVYQYLFFGILFPHIPLEHPDNWTNERKVEFSEYEEECLLEQTKYAGKDKGMNYYRITGQTMEGSSLELMKYDGYLWRRDNHLSPAQVYTKIDYMRDDIKNIWIFRLDQYLSDYGISE